MFRKRKALPAMIGIVAAVLLALAGCGSKADSEEAVKEAVTRGLIERFTWRHVTTDGREGLPYFTRAWRERVTPVHNLEQIARQRREAQVDSKLTVTRIRRVEMAPDRQTARVEAEAVREETVAGVQRRREIVYGVRLRYEDGMWRIDDINTQ